MNPTRLRLAARRGHLWKDVTLGARGLHRGILADRRSRSVVWKGSHHHYWLTASVEAEDQLRRLRR